MGAAGVNNRQDFNQLFNTFFYMQLNPNVAYVNGIKNPFFIGGFQNPMNNHNMNMNMFNNNNNFNMNNINQFQNINNNNQFKNNNKVNNFMQNNMNNMNNMGMMNNMNNNFNVNNNFNNQRNFNKFNNMSNMGMNMNNMQNNGNIFMNNLNNMWINNNNNNVKINNFMGNNMMNNFNNNNIQQFPMNNNMNNMNNFNRMNNVNNMNIINDMNNLNLNNMNNMNNNNVNNMNYNNMNSNMMEGNNCPQILYDLNKQFMQLDPEKQSNINEVINTFQSTECDTNVSLRSSQIDLNEEIKMNFKFLNGQCEEVKGKLGEKFLHVFNRFREEQCPKGLKNYLCCAVHNSLPVDKIKSLFDNNIKDGDQILFIKTDKNYKEEEMEEKEEEEEEIKSEEDEEEENKVISGWIREYKMNKMTSIINKIMELKKGQKLPSFKIKVNFDLESKDFKDFIINKFEQIGMKIEEHNHKVVFLKTNFDLKCNICNNSYSKSESRLFCSICEYNICNKCRKEKKYYKIGDIPSNALPSNNKINKKYIKQNDHEHKLVYCRTKRTGVFTGWRCDKCKTDYSNKIWSFYCTNCDYDLCTKCAQKEDLL